MGVGIGAGDAGMAVGLWLVLVMAGVACWTAVDTRQYRAFATATDADARLAFYWRWTAQSFLFLTAASLGTLWLLDRGEALRTLPPEFAALRPAPRAPASLGARSADEQLGMVVGFTLATLVAIAVWVRRVRSFRAPVPAAIAPLIPRNGREQVAALVLSLNAGYAEELFFRLALPLLLATVTGSAALGLAIALAIFGLIHWYQGWKGIVATALVGALLTLIYLQSGSLLRVMVTHAIIDVVGLVVRPMIADRLARPDPEGRTAPPRATATAVRAAPRSAAPGSSRAGS